VTSTASGRSAANARLKRWPGWIALLFVVVAALAIGIVRDRGPQSPGDRVDSIARRVACPVCDGESVFDSRNPASDRLRAEIRAQVATGELTDDQIIEQISDVFGGQILLVPRADGLEALVWALPAAALVCALAGLALAFRRWQVDARRNRGATEDDYDVVRAALRAESEPAADEPATEVPATDVLVADDLAPDEPMSDADEVRAP
jgi:cytochrome c-type biogenesis protein CcmH